MRNSHDTSPLLSNVCHRAVITPVSPPPTTLIHISPSCWTIYRSFEITLEMGTVHWIGLLQWSIQVHCLKKTFSPIWTMFQKILNCIGQLGLWWMSTSKARANEVVRTATSNDCFIQVTYRLQHERERPDMERKHMNSDRPKEKSPS